MILKKPNINKKNFIKNKLKMKKIEITDIIGNLYISQKLIEK